jgi:predicted CXXCH cytochrome family protein
MSRLFLSFILLLLLLVIQGCSKEKDVKVTEPEAASFVTAATCNFCHAEVYDEFLETGHPYKLNKVEGGVAPAYPNSTVPNPPGGYTWDDITYVIGGYGWKARFLDSNGWIITGSAVQWNLETLEWVGYHEEDPVGTKPYDCGRCHTTGYEASETEHQDGLPGIAGTWAEPGITCERCHGPGSRHAIDPEEYSMTIDRSADLCGECHYRSEDHRILASGGLIRHHEQYDEMLSAGHSNLRCVNCHDPHKSAKYDAENAITWVCVDCHSTEVSHAGSHDCVRCHMPKSVKSAVSSGEGVYLRGDIRSHVFAINSDTTLTQFYDEDGSTYSRGFNGLNFACLSSCHMSRDLEWAAQYAPGIHGN